MRMGVGREGEGEGEGVKQTRKFRHSCWTFLLPTACPAATLSMWANRSATWLQPTRHSHSAYCTQSHLVSTSVVRCLPLGEEDLGELLKLCERAWVNNALFFFVCVCVCFIPLRLPSMSRPKGLYWSNLPCPCSPALESRRDHVRPAGFVDVRIATERESVRICSSWYLSSWNLHTSGGPCFDWVDFFLSLSPYSPSIASSLPKV